MTDLPGRSPSPRCALALALAGWLVLLVGETGTHLVHHLLDPRGASTCQVVAAADHAPGLLAAPALVPRAIRTREAAAAPAPARPISGSRPAVSRGPPPTSVLAA